MLEFLHKTGRREGNPNFNKEFFPPQGKVFYAPASNFSPSKKRVFLTRRSITTNGFWKPFGSQQHTGYRFSQPYHSVQYLLRKGNGCKRPYPEKFFAPERPPFPTSKSAHNEDLFGLTTPISSGKSLETPDCIILCLHIREERETHITKPSIWHQFRQRQS